MIDVIVQREAAIPYRAPDIVDPLLTTEEVAVSRGRDHLCQEGAGTQPVLYEIPFQKGLRTGQLVKIRDATLAKDLKGKIVSIEHKLTRSPGEGSGDGALHVLTTLTVSIPTNFEIISDNS